MSTSPFMLKYSSDLKSLFLEVLPVCPIPWDLSGKQGPDGVLKKKSSFVVPLSSRRAHLNRISVWRCQYVCILIGMYIRDIFFVKVSVFLCASVAIDPELTLV